MISNLKTIQPTGAELFHVDGRTDGRETDKNDEASNGSFKAARRATPPVCPRALAQTIYTTAPYTYLISGDAI